MNTFPTRQSSVHQPVASTCRRRAIAGLTLVEMLVAVAAFTLISLGLAQVFAASGKTLRAGRQISRLTEYSAILERQLRRDIESMSRDGFLLIRHRFAANGQPILLWENDRSPGRPRRVDTLMFFEEGSFVSARDPVNPLRQARGSAARICYGHGLAYDPDDASFREAPRVDQPTFRQAVNQPSFGEQGPNQYASGWTLLRHLTVLAGPADKALMPKPAGANSDLYPDSEIQVGWQPAASSIFRFEAEGLPLSSDLPQSNTLVRQLANESRPIFESGIVDVATTDLVEIRSTILDSRPIRTPDGSGPNTIQQALSDDQAEDSELPDLPKIIWKSTLSPGDINSPNLDSAVRRQQAWMTNALPAECDLPLQEHRVRCEAKPPDYLGTQGASGAVAQPFSSDQETWRRTDQRMLSASNFVPHCTEFIVEWSFGNVYPDDYVDPNLRGQLIWHGLVRDAAGTASVAPYLDPDPPTTNDQRAAQEIRYLIPSRTSTDPQTPDLLVAVRNELIHYTPPGSNPAATLYSCFGYVDPLYPSLLVGGDVVLNNPDLYPANISWPWPRMIRITLSLADPQEPGIEQTFEYVFQVPERLQR